jgi:hypothetical protein
MFTCRQCNNKIKTLYERHGAKATYEAAGYYYRLCKILFDKTVDGVDQDRRRFEVQRGSVFDDFEVRRPGFEPGLPDWQSDVLDQTGRPSHATITVV